MANLQVPIWAGFLLEFGFCLTKIDSEFDLDTWHTF